MSTDDEQHIVNSSGSIDGQPGQTEPETTVDEELDASSTNVPGSVGRNTNLPAWKRRRQ
jgi:hypothetical protein